LFPLPAIGSSFYHSCDPPARGTFGGKSVDCEELLGRIEQLLERIDAVGRSKAIVAWERRIEQAQHAFGVRRNDFVENGLRAGARLPAVRIDYLKTNFVEPSWIESESATEKILLTLFVAEKINDPIRVGLIVHLAAVVLEVLL
jgi:hypothetical protein